MTVIIRVPGAAQREASLRAALQTRDRCELRVWNGPGSAAHHSRTLVRALSERVSDALALHRIRDTTGIEAR